MTNKGEISLEETWLLMVEVGIQGVKLLTVTNFQTPILHPTLTPHPPPRTQHVRHVQKLIT